MLLLGSAWTNQQSHHLSRDHGSVDTRKWYLRTEFPYFYFYSIYTIVVCVEILCMQKVWGLFTLRAILLQQSAESNLCSWTSFNLLWREAAVRCSADGVLNATYVCPSLFSVSNTGASILIVCCQLFLQKTMRVASHIHACSLRAAVVPE